MTRKKWGLRSVIAVAGVSVVALTACTGPQPDIAESASFTALSEYTVKLKPGQKSANGTDLDSKDVKFTFDRQLTINAANGPAALLANLGSVVAPDATTVVIKLKLANDQTFA